MHSLAAFAERAHSLVRLLVICLLNRQCALDTCKDSGYRHVSAMDNLTDGRSRPAVSW
jgi:hypothetical protein